MRILLILIVVKILELSRFNLTNREVPRSFYDMLSISLVLGFCLYLFSSKTTARAERRIEEAFLRFVRGRTFLIDIAVFGLVVFFAVKTTGALYASPIRFPSADMLPIIRGAGESILSGSNPFSRLFGPAEIPFSYLPMMIVYYLPAILAKIDMRLISLLAFAGIILTLYYYHRKNGFPLTGFFICAVIVSSGLFPFLLTSIHTFPYLLILALLLYSLSESNDKIFFFCLAAAMTSRKLFWLFVPFLLIHLLKTRKIIPRNLIPFTAGGLIGIVPFLFFPHSVIHRYFERLGHQAQRMQELAGHNSIVHSMGFGHYLLGHKTLTALIAWGLLLLLFAAAVKYLKKNNLWIFLTSALLIMTFFQTQTRAQEYYFFPLILFIAFSPLEKHGTVPPLKQPVLRSVLILVLVVVLFIAYPGFSGRRMIINPIRGHEGVAESGEATWNGYLEFSLGGEFLPFRQKGIELLIKRLDFKADDPARLKISVNDKLFFQKEFDARKIRIVIDRESLNEYFYTGANNIEIDLLRHELFSFKIKLLQ